MTRRAKAEQASGYTVLLVDDNPDYLQATRLLLEREGHNVLTATNGAEALGILPHQKVDLLLLDYFMPGMTGEQVVAELRKFDPLVQVILQTGYASEQPPRELLQRLDIQGYYDKTEGPEQLLLWTAVGLKAAHTVQLLSRSRRGIAYVLDRAAELHAPHSLDDLAKQIVEQAMNLLVSIGAAVGQSGCLVTRDATGELLVRAAKGAFTCGRARDVLAPDRLAAIDVALQEARGQRDAANTIVPLRVGSLTLGAIFLEQAVPPEPVLELLRLFANQAAAALLILQLVAPLR
ncbi:MAG TPA: response regulator [Polyangiaceae bacterium]